MLSLLLLKMEMLQCYGSGKASDLTGAKTKTCYICLQCIALTFAESLPKPAEVYAGICSVIWQASEKSSRSYVDYEQQWMEQSWKKLRAEPLCFKRRGGEELKVHQAHLTLRTYSYCRGKVVFLLLNEDVYAVRATAHMGYHWELWFAKTL